MKTKILKLTLAVSLLLNIGLFAVLVYQTLNGCAEIKNGRIGVLKEDIEVGFFGSEKTILKLPKGLIVKEASATGAGWFEPYRFRIVITSNNENLVDYKINKNSKDSLTEYYSAEVSSKK